MTTAQPTKSGAAAMAKAPPTTHGKHKPILHSVWLKDQTWARVFINSLPLYRCPFFGPDSRSGAFNHLLIPGENEITVELLKTKKLVNSEHLKHAFTLEIYEVLNSHLPDMSTEPVEQKIVAEVKYPEVWHATEEKFQRYPFYHRTTFIPDTVVVPPPFLAAPRAEFSCEGTPQLREAVEHVHGLLDKGDCEGFLDELSVKFKHFEQALKGEDRVREANKRRSFREDIFKYRPRPRPIDPAQLHFQPLFDGRVAYVTRLDGDYVLEAVCLDNPKRRVCTDLLMTQVEGRWRVFA